MNLHRFLAASAGLILAAGFSSPLLSQTAPRERLLINQDWRFRKGDPEGISSPLMYDARPAGRNRGGETSNPESQGQGTVIKQWILPTGNPFIKDPAHRYSRPEGNPGGDLPCVNLDFDDSSWRPLNLPHDWGVEGPFITTGGNGDTGRLPFFGVGWYRKKLWIPLTDAGKSVFLDIDGAMSYTAVWLNGQLVGGWPYGYASWRVDLTPFLKPGATNLLAIRLDNPKDSSRWYPGGGIYRNVWLIKTAPVHVGQWGTYLTTPGVSKDAATVHLETTIDNRSKEPSEATVATEIFALDPAGIAGKKALANFAPVSLRIGASASEVTAADATLARPNLWGPPPHQKPNRYVAVTTVRQGNKIVDRYETIFGIRSLRFDAADGFSINGEHVKFQGVCDHHDLGALGTALNYRALERQLEMLVEMGCNSIRTSHNPPAPELLDLADQMGLLVMDETFDCWKTPKRPLDYHVLFADWHEQDARMLARRDRNHPSVVLWSVGNEIPEQRQGQAGAAIAKELSDIMHQEDPTRPTTSAMDQAPVNSPFPSAIDTVGLNYRGAGNRSSPPQYPVFQTNFPGKFIYGSETASTISTRGEYFFPVATGYGAIVNSKTGEDPVHHQMSSYDLYYPEWATSPDKEFAAQHQYRFVGGEFVWTGWDYLGEPTPFSSSRSSYFGIIDLAGFKKDRFYLYQAEWRPEFPMAHILPHWNWPERAGLKNADGSAVPTPVHVYTSGDEGELFLNGKSLGRRKKGEFEYRLRWDDVPYQAGTLKVVTYKNGKKWAVDSLQTTGPAAALELKADRRAINADGQDLAFITATVADKEGRLAPRANNHIRFRVESPGEIVATDNGDPTSFESFQSPERNAFNGLVLVIVRAKSGTAGTIKVIAESEGLKTGVVTVKVTR